MNQHQELVVLSVLQVLVEGMIVMRRRGRRGVPGTGKRRTSLPPKRGEEAQLWAGVRQVILLLFLLLLLLLPTTTTAAVVVVVVVVVVTWIALGNKRHSMRSSTSWRLVSFSSRSVVVV